MKLENGKTQAALVRKEKEVAYTEEESQERKCRWERSGGEPISGCLPLKSSMSVSFFVQEVRSNPAVDAETAAVTSLNTLFHKSGLYLSTASTQLHVTPEAVCVIDAQDLYAIARHAHILVTNRDVQCDFSALSSVLWNQVKNVGDRIDVYLHLLESAGHARQSRAALDLQPLHLTLLTHALYILRQIEEPHARQEVRDAVSIVQKDVEMVVRLGKKLLHVLGDALDKSGVADNRFLLAAEMALCAVELLAASIASRSAIDVSPLITFFNSEASWRLSGISIEATGSYCGALHRLIRTLFARQNDFDGVERVTAKLLVNRLTTRPPFDWEMFKRIHPPHKGTVIPQYIVLCNMSTVQLCVRKLLLQNHSYVSALKKNCIRLLQEMSSRKEMLSFYQVPLLAALQGMPEFDLSDDAQLQLRAVETHLGNNEQIMQPNFLRILMAYGYTVPHEQHNPLTRGSVLSLFRAVTEQLFQLPMIQSGNVNKMAHTLLQPPVPTLSFIRLVVEASFNDVETASEVLAEMMKVLTTMYEASVAQCELYQTPVRVSKPLRRVLALTMTLLFEFFRFPSFVKAVNHITALEALARIYAIARLYVTAESNATETERKSAMRLLVRMAAKLVVVSESMKVPEVNTFFVDSLLPRSSMESLTHRNHQQYALLEAYLRAFASGAVVTVMEEETLLKHWVDVSLRCITNRLSGALAVAGLTFLSAVFLSKRAVAPLFVPTYVELMVPTSQPSRYGEPPLYLTRRFAKTVRACCQALEGCDERALEEIIHDQNSSVAKVVRDMFGNDKNLSLLENIRPISSILLVVSSLFDKVCALLGNTAGPALATTQDRLARFQVYYSALINLLQCRSTAVLHRVCASVEAVMLEQLRGVPSVQAQWIKHIGNIVDSLQGIGKTAVAEWFLVLSERTKKMIPHARL